MEVCRRGGRGGRGGKGVISRRMENGSWSNPNYINVGGGSWGFQAGVQKSDLILVFTSKGGVDSIIKGKFTLGADAAVAAGPVGRNVQASTDENLKAEIYSYSRSKGFFAGVGRCCRRPRFGRRLGLLVGQLRAVMFRPGEQEGCHAVGNRECAADCPCPG